MKNSLEALRRGLVPGLAILSFLAAAPFGAAAQTWHHVHLGAPDAAAARAWYIEYMGAEPRGSTGARVGSTSINIWEPAAGFEGSIGSVLDHIGFSVVDLEATLERLRAAGVEIDREIFEVSGMKLAFVKDPWGTRIELAQDPDRLGFHHVHAYVDDPEAAADWFAERFGGERKPFLGRITGIDYPETWVLFGAARDVARAPSIGRSFDHIGFTVDDMTASLAELSAQGVKITEGPRPNTSGTATIAYVEGPGGIRIELLQPGG